MLYRSTSLKARAKADFCWTIVALFLVRGLLFVLDRIGGAGDGTSSGLFVIVALACAVVFIARRVADVATLRPKRRF